MSYPKPGRPTRRFLSVGSEGWCGRGQVDDEGGRGKGGGKAVAGGNIRGLFFVLLRVS